MSRYKKSNAVQMSLITENFQQSEKNNSLVLHELTCTCISDLITFNCTLTSPILGTFTEMVINLKPNNKTLHT